MSGMIFKGQTINDKASAMWPEIYRECEKYSRFIIEVREYDENAEISDQQRKWLHGKMGPIHHYMKDKRATFADAKNFVKVRYGREWLVTVITNENIDNAVGVPYWECKQTQCQEVFHIAKALTEPGKKTCCKCGSENIQLIAIRSTMDVSIHQTYLWFNEIFDKIPILKKLYDEWKEKQEKKE